MFGLHHGFILQGIRELLPQDELFRQTAWILGSYIKESRLGGTD
jgi:hypothetical protein